MLVGGPIFAGVQTTGTVDGVFCPCTETTGQVVGARRLEALRKLGIRAGEARTVQEACQRAVRIKPGPTPSVHPVVANLRMAFW